MPREEGTVFVYNKTKETFLAYRVKVADSTQPPDRFARKAISRS